MTFLHQVACMAWISRPTGAHCRWLTCLSPLRTLQMNTTEPQQMWVWIAKLSFWKHLKTIIFKDIFDGWSLIMFSFFFMVVTMPRHWIDNQWGQGIFTTPSDIRTQWVNITMRVVCTVAIMELIRKIDPEAEKSFVTTTAFKLECQDRKPYISNGIQGVPSTECLIISHVTYEGYKKFCPELK